MEPNDLKYYLKLKKKKVEISFIIISSIEGILTRNWMTIIFRMDIEDNI